MLRGDVYYITKFLTDGSEQRGGRPGVIVSANFLNGSSRVVEVVYLTRKDKKILETHVDIEIDEKSTSTVLCEQITSVAVEKVGDYICTLSDVEMAEIDKALAISIGLDKYFLESK